MKRVYLSIAFLLGTCLAASALTPQSVLQAFEKMVTAVRDYQCRMWEYCFQGNEYEERTIDFYFKRPRFIRMDVLEGNRFADAGSSAVYRNDGRVTGRKGGVLALFPVTVDKRNPQATTIRGLTIDQGDMLAMVESMRSHLADCTCTLSVSGTVYELAFEPRSPASIGGVTREVIRLDAATLLPVSSDSWEGSRIVQHVHWDHFILDAGLPDELFDVRWDPARLVKAGIRTIHSIPLE